LTHTSRTCSITRLAPTAAFDGRFDGVDQEACELTEQDQQEPDGERLRITEIRRRMQAADLPTDDDIVGYERVSRFFGEQDISDDDFLGYLRVLDRLHVREGGIEQIRVCVRFPPFGDG
jgi:hypothetical protein